MGGPTCSGEAWREAAVHRKGQSVILMVRIIPAHAQFGRLFGERRLPVGCHRHSSRSCRVTQQADVGVADLAVWDRGDMVTT